MRCHSTQKEACPWIVIPLLVVLILGFGNACHAGSKKWPQWGGPNRNFRVESKGLAASWPSSGPRRLWNRPLGEGYSGIVVNEGKLYTMYRKDEQEVVAALDAGTGQTLWEHSYPVIVKKKSID